MTQTNDKARNDKLKQMLDYFREHQQTVEADMKKKVADLDAGIEQLAVLLRKADIGSPYYYRLETLRDAYYQQIYGEIEKHKNAIMHLLLAIQTAMVIESRLTTQHPTLTEEVERVKEELRKTVNEQIAKKVSGLFSTEGHEAMYGHA